MKNLEFMKELISRMDSEQLAHILTNTQCGNCWNMDCNLLGNHDIATCRANVQRWLELPCKEENPNIEENSIAFVYEQIGRELDGQK